MHKAMAVGAGVAAMAKMEEVMMGAVMAEVRAAVVMAEVRAVGTRVAATVLADIAKAVAAEAMAEAAEAMAVECSTGTTRPRHKGDARTQSIRPARCDSSTGSSYCICTARRAVHEVRAADARTGSARAAGNVRSSTPHAGRAHRARDGRTCAHRALKYRCADIEMSADAVDVGRGPIAPIDRQSTCSRQSRRVGEVHVCASCTKGVVRWVR